ncbi:Ig domain-containing protein [Corallococcus aberystwythensis]|uniref:Ig domain-containing protein n=1 Tax=Corallococcus aberystwythensis TaxID=2316722 RepID=A0A3A8QFT1_9BACT|nr:Ig domain-containing protein [Corallococcus aberystwythensis]RKH65750.1 Ig domain-containing protein [Corallococcus aberystwythensis]
MTGWNALARHAWMSVVSLSLVLTACGPEMEEGPSAPLDEPVLETSRSALTEPGQILTGGDRYTHPYYASGGRCVFETTLGTLPDTYLSLFGPNSSTNLLAVDDDSGVGLASRIEAYLQPGTYYATVRGFNSAQTGNYQIDMNCYGGIRYQSHVASYGWTGWTLDGQQSGTTGQNRRMEAVQMYLLSLPGVSVRYSVHLGDVGWTGEYYDGQAAGTTGQQRQMEAIKIWLTGAVPSGCHVNYDAHLAGSGWQGTRSDGQVSGTTGQNRRIEALRIWLSGC